MLKDQEQAEAVAAALQVPIIKSRPGATERLIVQVEDFANAYMIMLYLIVLGITATVVSTRW